MFNAANTFDAIVVGTGFGGAVTACRLVEAGFKVCVLERGRRYGPEDFPKYNEKDLFVEDAKGREQFAPPPDFSRWLWSADHGIYDVRHLDDVVSLQAAGYGGGSLIYANVHIRPPRDVFAHGWPDEYFAGKDEWALKPYYELAAYMLRVTPMPYRLAKTMRLDEAAPPGKMFRPPLAINFHTDGLNDFGRPQQPCDMRGRCFLGCDHRAKNTLDLNYLARVEDSRADIRTLAEVTEMRVRSKGPRFSVTYNDLLFRDRLVVGGQRKARVYADFVFLCAGAVHTTELLLKNKRRLSLSTPALGAHYFPNADSLAAVFDAAKPQEADYGPTITGAVVYDQPEAKSATLDAAERPTHSLEYLAGLAASGRPPAAGDRVIGTESGATATLAGDILDWGDWNNGEHGATGTLVLTAIHGDFSTGERLRIGDDQDDVTAVTRSGAVPHRHWFMVEDGGYPAEIEPLTGIFRSPLWLRRNRYLEPMNRRDDALEALVDPGQQSSRRSAQQAPHRIPAQRLRVQAFANALRGDPPLRGLGRTVDKSKATAVDLLEEEVGKLFPPWFTTAIRNDHRDALDQAAAMVLPLLGRFFDSFAAKTAEQLDATVIARLGADIVSSPEKREVLVRGFLRQALQVLAGSEAALARRVTEMAFAPVPDSPGRLLDLLGRIVLWALAYRAPVGHTGLLLVMGRDLYRGRLSLPPGEPGELPRLVAHLPPPSLDSASATQERVLREFAKGWQAELRTNPAWAPLNTRLTVHSQGGCPMGKDAASSVTAPNGQVHECEGLFVMDAAAFPTSVGVNPSATIAAIAEYKVEQFIRKHGHRASDVADHHEAWKARDTAAAQSWAVGQPMLDPLNQERPGLSVPTTRAIGLNFNESLSGFARRVRGHTNWDDLVRFPRRLPRFVAAESSAMRSGFRVGIELLSTVPDLAALISKRVAPGTIKFDAVGSVTLTGPGGPVTLKATGSLELFVRMPKTPGVPLTRFFRYKLDLTRADVVRWKLIGLKVLRNDPGMDVWQDTSTVYFELVRPGAGQRSGDIRPGSLRGIARVALQDFINVQLQSTDVTGTDDPARRSWALAAFYTYFMGELRDVYMTRTDGMIRLLTEALTGIHV